MVGTSFEYFAFRDLVPAEGTLPRRLGDAVLGSAAAEQLGLRTGDHLVTDQASLFNIAATYPVKLKITGVLAPSGSPDDTAVLVDVKTAWVIAGIGHGHNDLTSPKAAADVLARTDDNIVANAALVEYTEITDENIGSFHFHADRDHLPLASLIVVPNSAKDSTLLKGKFSVSQTRQLLDPQAVVADLLGLVFRIKAFLDRAAWVVYLIAGLFTALVVLLSLRLRREERAVLTRIGCSRGTIFKLQLQELGILLFAGLVSAVVGSVAIVAIFPDTLRNIL